MKKTSLRGPGGLWLVLDPSQVFEDDPGQGTPVMVWDAFRKHGATFFCAQETGELECGEVMLTEAQCKWLNSPEVEALVDRLYSEGPERKS